MLPRFLLFLPAFLFLTFQTLAQAFEPGLLVRSNGDTLRGEIENNFWFEPPTSVRFRATPESPIQLFLPRQLRAFSFPKGRHFRCEALPIDYAATTQLDRLPQRGFTNVRVDSLLAEVLVEGDATLLRVALLDNTHYLLVRAGRPVLDMSARRYIVQASNRSEAVVEGNNFRSQLLFYFDDCPAAASKGQAVAFTAAGLSTVAQAYNESCGTARQPGRNWLGQATPEHAVAFRGGLLMGARFARVERTAGDLTTYCPDCQARAFAGLYGELFQPGRGFAFYGELSLNSFQSRERIEQFTTQTSSGASATVYSYYDYRAWLGTARMGMRYLLMLPHEKQLVLGISYELNTVLYPTVTTINYTTSASTGLVPSLVVPGTNPHFASQTLLPNLTIGWRIRHFTIFTDGQFYEDYNGGGGLSKAFITDNFVGRLGVAYQLGRNPDAAAVRRR